MGEEDPRFFLDEPDRFGDVPAVWAWDNDEGIEIDSPGCGTAMLDNEQAERLMHWLIERYGGQ